MEDLIQREDAIEAVEFGITHAKMIDADGWTKPLFENENRELRKAIERIKDIPSAENKSENATRCYEFLKTKIGESIVDNEKEFESWYECMVWHVKECDRLAREPKQGEWIDKGWKGDWQFEIDGRGNCWCEYECSECGFHNKGSKSNYCPNCGARMK